MSVVWLAASFGYYLILSLTNTFTQDYLTALTSSFADMIAYVVSGFFYMKVGVKFSLILSFAISTIGGFLILFWGLDHQDSSLFFVLFLPAKFGVTCSFNINFASNQYFFPTLFASTAMGIYTFAARTCSSSSFVTSELERPIPMILFSTNCAITCISAFFLRAKEMNQQAAEKINEQIHD